MDNLNMSEFTIYLLCISAFASIYHTYFCSTEESYYMMFMGITQNFRVQNNQRLPKMFHILLST